MGHIRFIDVDHDDEKTYTLREEAATCMQSLPQELQEDILVRLPLKSISICRCVHKLWLKLLCSREFAKNHAIHSYYHQINNNPKFMIRYYDRKTMSPLIYSMDYASISSSLLSSCESPRKGVICRQRVLMENPFKCTLGSFSLQTFGSCNGLICLGLFYAGDTRYGIPSPYCKSVHSIYIWNPFTREYKNIPIGQIRKHDSMFEIMYYDRVKYGFGYDCRISDYKLVRIADYENTGCFNIHIYTLRSDSWRSTETNFPYLFARQARPPWLQSSGLLFNGALHWLGTHKISSESTIISFDISNGRLVDLPYPEETMSELEDSHDLFKNLCVLRGCLCLVLIYRYVRIDVWVMHNYGERESWKKWFTVPKSVTSQSYFWQPIWSFNDDEILVDNLSSLFVYDIKNTGTRNVSIAGVHHGPRNQPQSYVESLAPLYSGTYVRRKRKSKSSKRKRKRSRLIR